MDHDVQPLLTFCEENFECQDGEPRAYMEFSKSEGMGHEPTSNSDFVRVVYVVYAIQAKSRKAAESWMIDNVLIPLLDRGGKYLYWRKNFEFRWLKEVSRFKLRVRLQVLDKDYRAIEISDMIDRRETDSTLILDPRLDEGGRFYDG